MTLLRWAAALALYAAIIAGVVLASLAAVPWLRRLL